MGTAVNQRVKGPPQPPVLTACPVPAAVPQALYRPETAAQIRWSHCARSPWAAPMHTVSLLFLPRLLGQGLFMEFCLLLLQAGDREVPVCQPFILVRGSNPVAASPAYGEIPLCPGCGSKAASCLGKQAEHLHAIPFSLASQYCSHRVEGGGGEQGRTSPAVQGLGVALLISSPVSICNGDSSFLTLQSLSPEVSKRAEELLKQQKVQIHVEARGQT